MALFTSSYLKNLYQNRIINLNEDIKTRAFSSSTTTTFDIFLSHSYLDKEEVFGLYLDLKNRGFSVYVDWIVDPQLDRNNVTKESAELVRKRMKSSKSLLLAVSYNAGVSKWMPWELGFVDGRTGKCAIIPISQDNVQRQGYKGVEYLSLYPYVDKRNIIGYEKLYIAEDLNNSVSINDWLSRTNTSSSVRTF